MDDSLQAKLKALGVQIGSTPLKPQFARYTLNSIEKIFPGELITNQFGELFCVHKQFPKEYIHGTVDLLPRLHLSFIADYCHVVRSEQISSDRLVFLDTETTGLSSNAGTFPFLTGLCKSSAQGAVVDLLLCRTQSDEPAMLEELYRYVQHASAIVTYNGKSFDIPLLESRYAFYNMRSPFRDLPQIDLLQITREIWKRTLPSRSLGYIEMAILGFPRTEEEVPGYLIPQIYYDYIKSGDARPLAGVLYHNENDILSLIGLLNFLIDSSRESLQQLNPEDLQSIISLVIKTGDHSTLADLIFQLLELPAEKIHWNATQNLIAWLKKNDHQSYSIDLTRKAAESGEIWAVVDMAKHCEYQLKDYSQAMLWCEALEVKLNNLSLAPYSKSIKQAELQKRKDRIQKKLNRPY